MKILMVTGDPLIETGRSACIALSSELHKLGHKVSIVLPFYRSLLKDKKIYPKSTGVHFSVPVSAQYLSCEIFEAYTADGIQILFIGRDEFFECPEPFDNKGSGHSNNSARFAFYARCVIQLACRISPLPEIIQCYDWQAALIPAMIKDANLPFKTVLCISSLEHQGNFWSRDFAFTNLPKHYFSAAGLEFYGSLNFLKGGILFSDAIVFPSKRYVMESQRPEHGCGLDAVLREHSGKVHGICNGMEEPVWNHECDQSKTRLYNASDPKDKSICAAELLSLLRLEPSSKGPLIAVINQSFTSEGFDILLPVLDRLLAEDVRVVVSARSSRYDAALGLAVHRYPSKFVYLSEYNDSLMHRVLTGADIFLSPSDLELDGITIMKALKYGAVPVIRACSGFYQFIRDYHPASESGTGFVFYDKTPEALLDGVRRALEIFREKGQWTQIVARILSKDFSWKSAAQSYESIY